MKMVSKSTVDINLRNIIKRIFKNHLSSMVLVFKHYSLSVYYFPRRNYTESNPAYVFISNLKENQTEDWFSRAAPRLEDTFVECKVFEEKRDCSSLFERVVVPNGGKCCVPSLII